MPATGLTSSTWTGCVSTQSTKSPTAPKHMLQDLAEQIRASTDGRHIHLVAENSYNQAGWLKRRDDGRPEFYTAQWSDDIHHCLHTLVTGESFWYYADFKGRIDLLGR